MMEVNFTVLFLAALMPLIIRFFWYGPLLGSTWRKEMNFTKESLSGQNRIKVLALSYII